MTLALITPLLSSCAGQQEPANRTVIETLVFEKYLINDLYSKDRVISPDGRRVAFFGPNNSIVVDGIESKLNGLPDPYSLVFSPDSKHLAYTIQRDRKYVVVLDGVEGKPYARYDTYLLPSPNLSGFYYRPVFSPDSQHLAYAAQPEEGYCVVLDGVEGKHHEGAVNPKTITFSPDSKRLAYTTNIWIVLDGKEVAPGSEGSKLVFSPDSKQLGYIGYQVKEFPYPPIDYPVFSPDSQHFAYQMGEFIVVDGVEHKLIDALGASIAL